MFSIMDCVVSETKHLGRINSASFLMALAFDCDFEFLHHPPPTLSGRRKNEIAVGDLCWSYERREKTLEEEHE